MFYLVQVAMYTGVLWLLYMLLLRNRPMHAFNRGYLLAASVLPLVLPLLRLPEAIEARFAAKTPISLTLPEMIVGDPITAAPVAATPVIAWGAIIYGAVTFIALLVIAVKWLQLRRLVQRSSGVVLEGYTLLRNTGYGPGSWGRYVFLPDGEMNEVIIKHELAHVRLRHSADVMLLSVMQCLLWPNIFLYAIRKELRQVHEFQADAVAGADATSYAALLLSNLFNTCTLPFAHSFIIHPIKRRIIMLNKGKNTPVGRAMGIVTILLAVSLLSSVLVLQSCRRTEKEMMNPELVTDLSKAPAPPAGVEWNHYISDHLTYPAEAKKRDLEGRVMVKFTVNKDGNIMNAKVVSCTDSIFCTAALNLVNKMPNWTPGEKNGKKVAVEMYQPFAFSLGRITKVGYSMGKLKSKDNLKATTDSMLKSAASYDFSEMKPSSVTRATTITMGDANVDMNKAETKMREEAMRPFPPGLMDELEATNVKIAKENIKSYEEAAIKIQKAHDDVARAQQQIEKSQRVIDEESKKAEELLRNKEK